MPYAEWNTHVSGIAMVARFVEADGGEKMDAARREVGRNLRQHRFLQRERQMPGAVPGGDEIVLFWESSNG